MKFKNTKKEAKKTKSPSNSRTIPAFVKTSAGRSERFRFFLKIYRDSLKAFIVIIFLLAVFVVGIDLQKNLNIKTDIDMQRGNLTKELKFWEDFIVKHQDYRDAYFQASILEYKLRNTVKAKTYVKKGLSLDPNSEDGRKIEKILER